MIIWQKNSKNITVSFNLLFLDELWNICQHHSHRYSHRYSNFLYGNMDRAIPEINGTPQRRHALFCLKKWEFPGFKLHLKKIGKAKNKGKIANSQWTLRKTSKIFCLGIPRYKAEIRLKIGNSHVFFTLTAIKRIIYFGNSHRKRWVKILGIPCFLGGYH